MNPSDPEAVTLNHNVVLVVDDDAPTRELYSFALDLEGLTPLQAANGREALDILAGQAVDVVILDSWMPVMDGLQTLAAIRENPRTAALTVIFVTGRDRVADRVQGLDAGADDYLQKPIDPEELVARIRARLRSQDKWQRQLEQQLHSRAAVVQMLGEVALNRSPRETADEICSYIDLVSVATSSALVAFTDADAELLAGTGVFAAGVTGRLSQHLARRLRARSQDGGWIETRRSQPAGALGVPLADPDVEAAAFTPLVAQGELVGVLAIADARAQQLGDASRCLSAGMDFGPLVAVLVRQVLERDRLDDAGRIAMQSRIHNGAFRPVFQPVVRLSDGDTVGFEALTRFDDGARPDEVFAEARALGLGLELEEATARAAARASEHLPPGGWLAVNVSPQMMGDTARLKPVCAVQDRTVVLELTEHDPIHDYDSVRAAMAELGTSCRLSVDDAGAGYACLHHVLQLRPSFVKLDRGWVTGIAEDPARQALVVGLHAFAVRTGGMLIAEGIETSAELDVLTELGVPLGQGWFLGHPVAAEELAVGG